MRALPLSDLRANLAAMLDLVERGETVRVTRHGKPVADLVPIESLAASRVPNWKRRIDPLKVERPEGKTIAELVIEQREKARY